MDFSSMSHSRVTRHASRVTHHASRITHHDSLIGIIIGSIISIGICIGICIGISISFGILVSFQPFFVGNAVTCCSVYKAHVIGNTGTGCCNTSRHTVTDTYGSCRYDHPVRDGINYPFPGNCLNFILDSFYCMGTYFKIHKRCFIFT